MKIIHCTDIHGDFEALQVIANFAEARAADKIIVSGDLNLKGYTRQNLEELVETRDKQCFRQSVLKNMENTYLQFKQIFDSSGVPYYVIPGNYDSIAIESVFADHNIDRKEKSDSGTTFFGYGGAEQTPRHILTLEQLFLNDPIIVRFDEDELYKKLKCNKPTIAVIHQPPYGAVDYTVFRQHWGSAAITQYLNETNKTKLLLVGHVHESGPTCKNAKGFNGIGKINETFVINSGNLGRFELIDPQTMEFVTGSVLLRGRSLLTVPESELKFDWGTFGEIEVDSNGCVKKVVFYSIMGPDKKIVNPVQEVAQYNF